MPALNLARGLLRGILGPYSIYYIYRRDRSSTPGVDTADARPTVPIEERAVLQCQDPELRSESFYFGAESVAFGCSLEEQLTGLCFYWYGKRYEQRNFWPLRPREAKLVQVIVASAFRGRGVATTLIRDSAALMLERGFEALYARIWHSNAASWRAFERAGWQRIALVIEIDPLRTGRPLRYTRRIPTTSASER